MLDSVTSRPECCYKCTGFSWNSPPHTVPPQSSASPYPSMRPLRVEKNTPLSPNAPASSHIHTYANMTCTYSRGRQVLKRFPSGQGQVSEQRCLVVSTVLRFNLSISSFLFFLSSENSILQLLKLVFGIKKLFSSHLDFPTSWCASILCLTVGEKNVLGKKIYYNVFSEEFNLKCRWSLGKKWYCVKWTLPSAGVQT